MNLLNKLKLDKKSQIKQTHILKRLKPMNDRNQNTPKTSKRIALLLVLLAAVFSLSTSRSAQAAHYTELEIQEVLAQAEYYGALDPILTLDEVLLKLFAIEDHLESYEKPQLNMMISAVTRLLSALRDRNRGLGHLETFQEFQNLILVIDFSRKSYFEQIQSAPIRPLTASILKLTQELKVQYGFDKAQFSKILASGFAQLSRLHGALSKANIPDELRKKLLELKPKLGVALSHADALGDRPTQRTFELSFAVYKAFEELTNEFYTKLAGSKEVFLISLEIMALNEYIGNYIQADKSVYTSPSEAQ